MEDNPLEERLIRRRERRQRRQQYKDLAARSCSSALIVMVALVLLRPVLVNEILSRADAYNSAGQLDECKRQCDKALLIDDDSSRAWCLLARMDKTGGDRDKAYAAYEEAVRADGTNISAHFELGMMYLDDGRYQPAIPHFEQVRAAGPDAPQQDPSVQSSYHRAALYMLVLCYEKVGDSVKTELTLKEIRVFYPECGDPKELLVPLRANGLVR